MCGRFTQRADSKKLSEAFGVTEVPAVEARYNIEPTQDVLAVRYSPDGWEATYFKWGLVPSWAKDTSMGARPMLDVYERAMILSLFKTSSVAATSS